MDGEQVSPKSNILPIWADICDGDSLFLNSTIPVSSAMESLWLEHSCYTEKGFEVSDHSGNLIFK